MTPDCVPTLSQAVVSFKQEKRSSPQPPATPYIDQAIDPSQVTYQATALNAVDIRNVENLFLIEITDGERAIVRPYNGNAYIQTLFNLCCLW